MDFILLLLFFMALIMLPLTIHAVKMTINAIWFVCVKVVQLLCAIGYVIMRDRDSHHQ